VLEDVVVICNRVIVYQLGDCGVPFPGLRIGCLYVVESVILVELVHDIHLVAISEKLAVAARLALHLVSGRLESGAAPLFADGRPQLLVFDRMSDFVDLLRPLHAATSDSLALSAHAVQGLRTLLVDELVAGPGVIGLPLGLVVLNFFMDIAPLEGYSSGLSRELRRSLVGDGLHREDRVGSINFYSGAPRIYIFVEPHLLRFIAGQSLVSHR